MAEWQGRPVRVGERIMVIADQRKTRLRITVPVGDGTLGHVWNVIGEPLDIDTMPENISDRWDIHRPAPPFERFARQCFEIPSPEQPALST